MKTIKGKISRIVFCNEETGYKVLKISTTGGSSAIVTGEFGPEVIPGSVADFHGDYKTSKYGYQFKTKSYTISFDANETASIRLFIDTIAPNVGTERSNLIVKHFGKDTIDVLDKEPHRLSEVAGIGEKLSSVIAEAWVENKEKWKEERQQYSLRAFLNSLGIKERRVKKVLAHFGGGLYAEEKIRENPYVLCDLDGFGFTTADHIAKQVGLSDDSELRFKAFVVYSLEIICPSYGHMYLEKQDIIGFTKQYCAENATTFLGKDITEGDLEGTLNVLSIEKKIIVEDTLIYSKPCYDFEKKSAVRLAAIVSKESDLIFLNRDDVEKHIEVYERENNISLSEKQKDALYDFAEKKVFVITGGPGTGKTTVLRAIVSLIKKLRLNLTCMTPTGISAKKLATTVDFDAYTIHRRLGFKGGYWTHDESNTFETDVVILDESSMIDQEVLYRMLCALKDRVHIIFVGDDNQLPSVGAGNVLREIINCGHVPVVKLDQIFRQNEASDIIKVAHKIKNGDTDLSLFKSDPTADVFFMREQNPVTVESIVVAIAQRFKKDKKSFQIITPRNQGPCSVESLNNILQSTLNPGSFDEKSIRGFKYTFKIGDRVIITKNDYEKSVFNGDIGKISSIGCGFLIVTIDGRVVEFSIDEINEKIRLAYAISVHKCIPLINTIFLKKGIIKFSGLKNGDEALTDDGSFKKVVGVGNYGKKQRIRITTKRGYVVYSSIDHRFLVADRNGEKLLKAIEIKKGVFSCISRKGTVGEKIKIPYSNKKDDEPGKRYSIRKKFYPPTILDEDIAWMMGILIGDGYYNKNEDGMISLGSPSSIGVLKNFTYVIKKMGLHPVNHKRKGKPCQIDVVSKNFREWLLGLGLEFVKGIDKKIPDIVFRSTVKFRFSFISGLIDSDGNIKRNGAKIKYSTISEQLSKDIQILLLSLGITSTRASYKQSKKSYGKEKIFCVSVVGNDCLVLRGCLKLYNENRNKINVKMHRKNILYNRIPYGSMIAHTIKKELENKKIKISVHFKKIYDILCKNNLTYGCLENMHKKLKKYGVNIPLINRIINNHFLYDEVVSIEKVKGYVPMMDCEIDTNHFYVTDGFVCHNSQGLEYPYIIIPFINQHGKKLLQRNLLYTALTRAKEKVIIIGHGSAIEKAINNSSVSKRNTKLGERIGHCLLLKQKSSSLTQLEEPVTSPDAPSNTEQSSLGGLISCLTELTEE